MKKTKEKEIDNTIGVLALIFAFIIPLVGIILAIISLARNEKTSSYAIWAIIISVLNWIAGMFIIMSILF